MCSHDGRQLHGGSLDHEVPQGEGRRAQGSQAAVCQAQVDVQASLRQAFAACESLKPITVDHHRQPISLILP